MMLYLFGMWENVPVGRHPGGIWGGCAVSGDDNSKGAAHLLKAISKIHNSPFRLKQMDF